MRPLTDKLPKPLLPLGGATLIEHQIRKLESAGFRELVINLCHLGEKIAAHLGDGENYGVGITYSRESEPLETGGGVRHALPLLGPEPFGIVNADVFTNFDYARLRRPLREGMLANLVMVDNPPHHPAGDFAIGEDGRLVEGGRKYTYSGIGVMHPEFVTGETGTCFTLRKKMDESLAGGTMTGSRHRGFWCDVGTPDRYERLRASLERPRQDHGGDYPGT